jgi:hypothetical protein
LPSSMTTQSEPSEPNLQPTNIQTPLNEHDRPARQGPTIPGQNSDEILASASTNPTPQQDGAPVPLPEDKQSIVPEAVKAERDVRSPKRGSTGPRSEAGKQRSSRNAFKHGIFANVVVVPGESSARYRSLLENLRDERQPEGLTEEFLTEIIANIMWRLRRLYTAESAEIRQGREFIEWDERNRQTGEAEEIGTKSGEVDLLDTEPGLIWNVRNPVIVGRCLELLLELQHEIKAGGFEHKRDTAFLKKIYGTNNHLRKTLYQSYFEWAETSKLKKESQRQGFVTAEEFKKFFLSRMAKEIRRLRDYQREHTSVESERMKLEVLRRNVSGPESCEHLRKNEVTLLKELDRIMNLLDRMQRLRRGQPVAPRIDVNL